MADKHYANYLQHQDQHNLNLACLPLKRASAYGVFLVGSVLHRRDWRDVDVRCIVPDDQWEIFKPWVEILNASISEWLRQRTGLPVDFQFQQMTAANAEFSSAQGHPRHALGMGFLGDGCISEEQTK